MLLFMESTATNAPNASPQSFAGMLAALTAPAPKPAPAWNDDLLADDVATLSYEHALRAHGRYRSVEPPPADFLHEDSYDRSLTQARPTPAKEQDSGSDAVNPAMAAAMAARAEAIEQAAARAAENGSDWSEDSGSSDESAGGNDASGFAQRPAARFVRNLKDASVTIRLSKTECEQLHQRAAEAGMTVSAYLRSCTFEAETLRTMVKETLAQLRTATTAGSKPETARPRRSWTDRIRAWFRRMIPRRINSPRVARA